MLFDPLQIGKYLTQKKMLTNVAHYYYFADVYLMSCSPLFHMMFAGKRVAAVVVEVVDRIKRM